MFKLKKRCIRCYHVLREDGTCQNPDCVRYTPEKDTTAASGTTTTESDGEAASDTPAAESSTKDTGTSAAATSGT